MDHPLGHVGGAVFGSKAPARGRGIADCGGNKSRVYLDTSGHYVLFYPRMRHKGFGHARQRI